MSADRGMKATVYMPPELLQRLQQHARRHKTSVSEICRNGALRELETPEATRQSEPQR